MKRIGPEIKLADLRSLRVPAVIEDLYFDLKERRLLPLVALILVAIVATPFVLGGGDDKGHEKPSNEAPIEASSSSASEPSLVVVPEEPGLRNYRKRLTHRNARNPFEPRFTGPVLDGTQVNGPSEVTTTTATTATSETPVAVTSEPSGAGPEPVTPAPSSPSGGGGAESGTGGKPASEAPPDLENPETRLYQWSMKVQISHTETAQDGSTELSEPEVREGVKSLIPLPGEGNPVITFIGVNPTTGMALFVVSKEVTAMFGDAKCVSGTTSCELVELEKGFPQTFEYGPDHQRWKFKVITTELVRTKNPEKG